MSETSKVIDIIDTVVEKLSEVEDYYKELYDGVHYTDLETSDILHEIEFGKFNAVQRCKILGELKSVRINRRQMKDEQELLQYIYNFMQNNKKLLFDLKKIQIQTHKRNKELDERVYSPRVRTGLVTEEESNLELIVIND